MSVGFDEYFAGFIGGMLVAGGFWALMDIYYSFKLSKETEGLEAGLQARLEALQNLEDALNELPTWEEIHEDAKAIRETIDEVMKEATQ